MHLFKHQLKNIEDRVLSCPSKLAIIGPITYSNLDHVFYTLSCGKFDYIAVIDTWDGREDVKEDFHDLVISSKLEDIVFEFHKDCQDSLNYFPNNYFDIVYFYKESDDIDPCARSVDIGKYIKKIKNAGFLSGSDYSKVKQMVNIVTETPEDNEFLYCKEDDSWILCIYNSQIYQLLTLE